MRWNFMVEWADNRVRWCGMRWWDRSSLPRVKVNYIEMVVSRGKKHNSLAHLKIMCLNFSHGTHSVVGFRIVRISSLPRNRFKSLNLGGGGQLVEAKMVASAFPPSSPLSN